MTLEQRPSVTGNLGGRRGRLVDNVAQPGRTRAGSVSSVGSLSVCSASSGISSQVVPARQGWFQRQSSQAKARDRDFDPGFVRELGSQLRWRNRNLLELSQTFLPTLVSEVLLKSAVQRVEVELPILEHRSGCVAKVNCSGFVELTARLERHSNGAAMLSRCINRFYTHVIDIVMAYRGDVVRFNANTIVIFFEAAPDSTNFNNACGARCCAHTAQELACIRAAACCFELHKHLHHVDVGEGGGQLSLQIGVGAGSMRVLVVQGGPSTESETSNRYTVSGSPLDQATQAELLAGACETVFSPQAWQHVSDTVREGEPVKGQPDFHRFVAFDTRKHTYPMVRHAALQSLGRDNAFPLGARARSGPVRRGLALLMNFLPDSVLRHLWAGTLSNVNELRTLSIAFVYVKGLDTSMTDGAETVSGVVSELQRAAFAEEGFLHRFLLDDQGLLLQFAFGMPPLVHTDDPLRACRACFKMLRVVGKYQLTGHAGIATGKVFCGLVGSDRRHEYGIVGSAVERAIELSAAAAALEMLVDDVTHQSCEADLDFEDTQATPVQPMGEEKAGEPGASKPPQAFRVIALRAEREMRLANTTLDQSRTLGRQGWLSEPGAVDRTPCTPPPSHPPPWLANTRREGKPVVQWEQPIPTLWTHICAERPPPPPSPPRAYSAGHQAAAEAMESGGLRSTASDTRPWRTYVKVPLPWPARSAACGGVSPLPKLRSWRHLEEAEQAVDDCVERGGGLLVLAGPFGCGKTELTEHLVTRAVKGPTCMQPIFGCMEVRVGHAWAAITGVLRGALALLQPAGRIHSARELAELLRREVISNWEERALVMAGLLDPTTGVESESAVSAASSAMERRGSVRSTDPDVCPLDSDLQPLVDLALRLVDRLLERGKVVLALRISQGTSLLPVETNGFWLLARGLGSLAERCSTSKRHCLLVFVTCRESHVPIDLASRMMQIGPLTGPEVQRYIHLCLGLSEDSGDLGTQPLRAAACLSDFPSPGLDAERSIDEEGGETVAVPEVLLQWLRRIADLPRHLEEGLTQLRHAGVIAITGGRCVVNADVALLNTADWIHTHMVGRIISQMEAMVPEMQHVLQIATVLPGPFSSLDLAAAIRVHLAWDTPNMMACYLCVKHLIACGELVRAGFLRRIDLHDPNHSGGESDQYDESEELNGAPRWIVTSFLIQQVVSSTVLQGMRMQLKRAILLSRATERLRWTRRTTSRHHHRPSDASVSSEAARSAAARNSKLVGDKKMRTVHRTVRAPGAPMDVNVSNTKYLGLPSSCIVTSTSLDGMERKSTQITSGMDSDDISFDMPPRTESNFNIGARKAVNASSSLMRHFPWRRLRQCLVLTILAVVLLYPDLWIILEGSPSSLDAVMLLAMSLFSIDMLHCFLYDDTYTYRSLFTDIVLLICCLLDVSWAMGKSTTDFVIQRRDPSSVWRLMGLYIKFGACAVRLNVYIRSMAGLLHYNWQTNIKNRISKRHEVPVVPTQPQDASMLENISQSLTQAILMHLVSFTIVMIVCVQVVDLFTPPQEDASMQSWVQLLAHEASINSSIAAPSMQGELRRFKEFYSDMAYGPYSICLGITPPDEIFRCQNSLWASTAGADFADPLRQSFRKVVHSSTVQAAFDFSGPAKHEALIRMAIISSTIFCMVFVSLTLDYVANVLIVAPLARLMPTVRQVMAQLKEKFPKLAREVEDGEERDEVAAFEELVEKVTLIVTVANKNSGDNQDTGMASEWISGIASQKGSPKSVHSQRPSRILTHIVSEAATNDVRRLQKLGVSYEKVDSWDYDVLALDRAQLTGVTGWLLMDSANPWLALPPQVVVTFMEAMVEEYKDENPYHNWAHACDVSHGVFRSCQLNKALEFATRVDVFALLVAAISHDAGHPGLNNIFLVQSSHELALRYNDVSPLENMHCSTMFAVLSSRPEANVFALLSREQYREARQVCIETILHTDNAKHFEMVKELQMFYHTNSEAFERPGLGFPSTAEVELLSQPKHRKLALQAMLHGADISNPCKPWDICEAWADLVLSEFFAQGDKEKALGMTVQPLNNRETVNKPSSQVAFIEFFIYPFNTALVKIFAPLWEMSENLSINLQRWHAMRTAEEQEKALPKVNSICEDLQAVIQGAKAEVRLASKVSNPVESSPRVETPSSIRRSATWAMEVRTSTPSSQPSPARGQNKTRTTVAHASGDGDIAGASGRAMVRQTSTQSFGSERCGTPKGSPMGSPKGSPKNSTRPPGEELKEVVLPNSVPGGDADP